MLLKSIKEQYVLWAIKIIVALILFLPFLEKSTFYFPFITPRNFSFRILVEILLFFYILLIIKNPVYLPKKNIVLLFFLLFVVAMSISSLFGGEFSYSFWSNFERMDGLIALYHQFIFLFIILACLRKKEDWIFLLQANIFAATVIAFVGLSQVFKIDLLLSSSSGERISSTLGNPTYLAAYLLLQIFVCLYFISKKKAISDASFYKYGFIALDVVLLVIQGYFEKRGAKTGIIQQMFKYPGLYIPFVLIQILALSQFFKQYITEKLNSIVQSAFYSSVAILFLFLIMKTQTRGALVGLGISLAVTGILLLFKKGVKMYYKWGILFLFFLCITGIVWLFHNKNNSFVANSPILSRIASISKGDLTTQTRLATWKAAYQGFLEKPIFGWGVENFYRVFDKYFPTVIYRDENAVVWYDRAHNALIQYAVEGGGVALLLYLGMLGSLIYLLLKHAKERYFDVLFIGAVVAYIGQNFFVFDSINSYMLFYFLLGFMLFAVDEKFIVSDNTSNKPLDKKWRSIQENDIFIILFSAIIIAGTIWYFNVVPAKYNTAYLKQYQKISREVAMEKAPPKEDIMALMKIAREGPYLGRFELVMSSAEKILYFEKSAMHSNYETNEFLEQARKNLGEIIALHPYQAQLYIFSMMFHLNSAGIDSSYLDEAIKLFDTAKKLSPTRAQIYIISGLAYMKKNMYKKAVEEFEEAVRLAPKVLEPNINLLLAYVGTNDAEKSREQLKKINSIKGARILSEEEYKKIARSLAAIGWYKEAEEYLIEALSIREYSLSANLYAGLAYVYSKEGKLAQAKEMIQKAVGLDPSYKTSAENFLKDLKE